MALAQKQEELPPKQLQAPFSSAEFTIVTELDRGATFRGKRRAFFKHGPLCFIGVYRIATLHDPAQASGIGPISGLCYSQ